MGEVYDLGLVVMDIQWMPFLSVLQATVHGGARLLKEAKYFPPNIELSSAADHDQRSKFLTGLDQQFQAAFKATAPTICYVHPEKSSAIV